MNKVRLKKQGFGKKYIAIKIEIFIILINNVSIKLLWIVFQKTFFLLKNSKKNNNLLSLSVSLPYLDVKGNVSAKQVINRF